MNVKALVALLIVLSVMCFSDFRVKTVVAGNMIRIRTDGSISPLGTPLSTVDNVTYTLSDDVGSIFLERDNIILDGAGHSVQGRGIGSGTGIYLNGRSNVEIRNLKIEAFDVGLLLNGSCDVLVTKNLIVDNEYGIQLFYSSENMISENDIFGNSFGVGFADQSENNTVFGNAIRSNYDGFWLRHSSNNTIFANGMIGNDMYSLAFYYSSDNSVYDNNLTSNQQIYCDGSANAWDDGYPSGGNYWSDFVGVDSNQDGIIDCACVLDANNTDNYPLAGSFLFYSFSNSTPSLLVTLVSNSTVSDFTISVSPDNPEQSMIRFNVTAEGGSGFCRVCIPAALMNGTYHVIVDGEEPYYVNYSVAGSTVERWIYFAYPGSSHQITIVPEFSCLIILPLFTAMTLLAVRPRQRKQLARASSVVS